MNQREKNKDSGEEDQTFKQKAVFVQIRPNHDFLSSQDCKLFNTVLE